MVFKPQTFYGNDPITTELNPTDNALLETRVAEALARAADIEATNVMVTAMDRGELVLRGSVSYPEEVAIAGDIASRIEGVSRVINEVVSTNAPRPRPLRDL